jgi:hypothetical protein
MEQTERFNLVVEEAVKHFKLTCADEEGDEAIRQDFRAFLLATLRSGCKGMRMNFNGCIFCTEEEKKAMPIRVARVLLLSKEIKKATGGRSLTTVVCENHIGKMATVSIKGGILGSPSTETINAALRRIEEEPTRM